jgi:hypothetical protein
VKAQVAKLIPGREKRKGIRQESQMDSDSDISDLETESEDEDEEMEDDEQGDDDEMEDVQQMVLHRTIRGSG